MTYRTGLLAVALLAIAGIGITAGLKPPGFIWILALEFTVLILTFGLFVRRQRSDRALDRQVKPAFDGITHTIRRHITRNDRLN